MIETKNIRNLYAENMDDDLDKIISLDFLKNNDISGGSTLGGTQYLFVQGKGTPEENGVELLEAYEAAENMPRYLGLLYANSYYNLYKGQTYFIQGPNVYATQTKDEFSEIANASQNVIEKEQAEATKTTILIAPGTYKFSTTFEANLSGVRLSSITGEMDVIIDGNINQTKDDQEFIGLDLRNNTFSINSINTNSVYKNISALGDYAFGGDSGSGGDVSGTFINCNGGEYSFSGWSTASGTFIDCKGGNQAFGGGAGGEASGTFTNCKGDTYSFGGESVASGTFTNCTGGENSFGGNGGTIDSSARLYYCKLISGTFTTPNPGGKLVLCIDGDNNVVTTDDSTIPISPISTSVFEKDLTQNATYNWGADLTIDEKDDVYFISLNPNVATVTQSGVVKMLVDDANPAFAEILAVGKTNTERLLVFSEGLSGFKVYHNSADDINALFTGNAWLVKPDGAWVELANSTAENCPKGWIYLIFDDVSSIDISSNYLKGELKSIATSVSCYNNQLTSLSLPNAEYVYCNNNQLTSLSLPTAMHVECYNNQITSLSAPNATYVNCPNNQLTSLNVPNATEVSCYNNQLTASAIAALLNELKNTANEYGYFDVSGPGNAPISEWTAQAILDKDYLINTLNWDVMYNL